MALIHKSFVAITKADVMGYSMGGGVALHVAARRPDLVRKLALVSAAYKRDGSIPSGISPTAD